MNCEELITDQDIVLSDTIILYNFYFPKACFFFLIPFFTGISIFKIKI